jgi:hypothetical protein
MKLQLVLAGVCLFGSVLLAEGVGPIKGKKPPITKGKVSLPPSPKPAPVGQSVKPPKFNGPNKKAQPYQTVKDSSSKWKMDSGQKAALDKLLGGQTPMTDRERQQLTDLLFNGPQAGLTKEDESALSYLLLDETARHADAATSPPSDERIGAMFVRIYNNTGERLKVWVQVVADVEAAKNEDSEPNDIAKKPETLQYQLETGKAYDLHQNGERLKASAIRVWAISPTRSWALHRDRELFLTPAANQSKTYTLTFSK